MCTDVLMNDYVGRGKETFTYMYKECKHYSDEPLQNPSKWHAVAM